MLKHGILGLLNYYPMTGYEINEVFRESLDYFWVAQTSQIYRELQTLKAKGWVEDELIEQKSRPDKKLFRITGEGQRELRRWLKAGDPLKTNIPLLMKSFFFSELPVDDARAFYRHINDDAEGFLAGADEKKEKLKRLRDSGETGDSPFYWEMTLDYGLRYYRMLAEWAESCIGKLDELEAERAAGSREESDAENDGCGSGAESGSVVSDSRAAVSEAARSCPEAREEGSEERS